MPSSSLKRRLAAIILFNEGKDLLLQYRDAAAPTSPNQWSLPGGGIEPGETPRAAIRRELLEESGLQINEELLTLFWYGLLPSYSQPKVYNEWNVFAAEMSAHQEDIIVGEGLAMMFVPLRQAFSLNLSSSADYFLSLWLHSAAESGNRL